jgi:hypothetical protein
MEGIDIDSIVRKAVTEYRRQEREKHVEATAAQTLAERVARLERCLGDTQRRLWALEDLAQMQQGRR